MNRQELEKYLNEHIEITLFDNTTRSGILERGNGFFQTPKDYYLRGAYFSFKLSHIKKVRQLVPITIKNK